MEIFSPKPPPSNASLEYLLSLGASLVRCVFDLAHYFPVYIGSDSMKPAQLKYILLYFTSTTQPEYSTVRNFGSIKNQV